MKKNYLILTLLFLIVSLGTSAEDDISFDVPQDWTVTPEKELQRLKDTNSRKGVITENKMIENKNQEEKFSKGVTTILNSTQTVLSEVGTKSVSKGGWHVDSIMAELAVEPSGSIGLLGLKGETAVELIWQKKSAPSSISKERIESDSDRDDSAIQISKEMSDEQILNELSPFVDAAISTNKINPNAKEKLENNLLRRAKGFQKLITQIGEAPTYSPWWFYQFQIELKVDVAGEVIPGLEVGVAARFRLQWKKIESITDIKPKSIEKANSNEIKPPLHHFIETFANDLKEIDTLQFNSTNYDVQFIKVGIGIGAKGDIYIAKSKADIIGSLFFKREFRKLPIITDVGSNKDFGTLPIIMPPSNENDHYLLQDTDTNQNRELASLLNIPYIKSDNKSLSGHNLYKLNRTSFRKGLNKSMRMAKFFIGATSRMSNSSKWDLDTIGLEFELVISGEVGLTTLRQKSIFEIYLKKRES